MALLLTTRPAESLGLRRPTRRALVLAVLLAVFLLPPLAELTVYICRQFPAIQTMLKEGNPLTRELELLAGQREGIAGWLQYLLVLGCLAPLCEELAFRGFLLTALRRRFRTWTAILFCSFLFALYHANVFQFLPAFILGAVLGLLTVRTGSILPGVLFHVIHNSLLLGVYWLERTELGGDGADERVRLLRLVAVGLCMAVSAGLLWRVGALRTPVPVRLESPGHRPDDVSEIAGAVSIVHPVAPADEAAS
jgi:sodium transport system permease protein